MKQTVVGLFSKPSEAQQAVQQLTSNGFDHNNVDLSIGSTTDDSATRNNDFDLDNKNDSKNNDHESGVMRFFKNLFGSDDDTNTNRYSQAAMRGNSIVTVHAESADEAERAADILDDNGAISVDDDAEGYDNYNTNTGAAPVGVFNETAGASASTPDMDIATGSFNTTDRTNYANDTDMTGKTSIPVIQEELQVGKRTVETGGKRLRSRIIENPVEENLRLKEERVYVNRTPVNRAATDSDFNSFNEGEIELKEYAEVPVVSKQARVVEEVTIDKETNERNETVRDTVRSTEVKVEDLTGNTNTSATSSTGEIRKDN